MTNSIFNSIPNIVLNINNRIASIILSTDINEQYRICDNILYLNSLYYQNYTITLYSISLTNDAELTANMIHTRFTIRPVNAPDIQQVYFKSIYSNTMIRSYTCLMPVMYTFNESCDIILDNNYSSPILYMRIEQIN